MITYDRLLRALLVRLCLGRWGLGADLYAHGLTLWAFAPRRDLAADFDWRVLVVLLLFCGAMLYGLFAIGSLLS